MQISIRIGQADSAIVGAAIRQLTRRLNVAFHQAAGGVRRRVGQACDGLIQGTPEYQSLLSGTLLGELGIPGVEPRLHSVLRAVRDGVDVSVVPFRATSGRLSGGITIGILPGQFQDLLGLPSASYVSGPSGETIRWLDWLLLQGDRIVVAGYDSFFDLTSSQKSRSRTGLALMRRGQGWHVPFEFSGTESSNFLIRAFDVAGVEALLAKILREEIEARLI